MRERSQQRRLRRACSALAVVGIGSLPYLLPACDAHPASAPSRVGAAISPLAVWTPAPAQWTDGGNPSSTVYIPMCWLTRHFLDEGAPGTGATREPEKEKAFAEDLVTHYWASNLNITVTWEECPTFPVAGSSGSHVRVLLTNGTAGAGWADTGRTALLRDDVPEYFTDQDGEVWPKASMVAGTDGLPLDTPRRIREFQKVILHEFGHLLGFVHEFDRGDIPHQPCPNGAWRETWDTPDSGHYDAWNSGEIKALGFFDYDSIMGSGGATYCNDVSVPSSQDIVAAQKWYGKAPDYDGDGLVGSQDNCPSTFNPDQSNCNLVFEQAKQERSGYFVERLGDACDPVPCPKMAPASGVEVPGGVGRGLACEPSQPYITFFRRVRDELFISPLPSRQRHHPNAETPLADVPTHFRYCQNDLSRGVRCQQSAVLRNSMLETGRDPSFVFQASASSPWQPISLKLTRSSPDTPPDFPRTNIAGIPMRYASGEQRRLFWDFRADNEFWTRTVGGIPVDVWGVGQLPSDDPCRLQYFGKGTCLHDGYIWTHAASSVGRTDVDRAWANRDDLSNHVVAFQPDQIGADVCVPQGFPPDLPSFDPCEISPDGCADAVFVRPSDCLTCNFGTMPDFFQARVLPVAHTTAGVGVLFDGHYRFTVDTLGLDPLHRAFSQTGVSLDDRLARYNFVTAVEHTGPQVGNVDAVALSREHLGGLQTIALTQNGFEWGYVPDEPGGLWPDWANSMDIGTGRDRSYGRTHARVLFSRAADTVFVVGGVDDNGSSIKQVEYLGLNGARGVVDGETAGRVHAATLASAENGDLRLWTIESTEVGAAVVLRSLAYSLDSAKWQLSDLGVTVPIPFDSANGYRLAQNDDGWAGPCADSCEQSRHSGVGHILRTIREPRSGVGLPLHHGSTALAEHPVPLRSSTGRSHAYPGSASSHATDGGVGA